MYWQHEGNVFWIASSIYWLSILSWLALLQRLLSLGISQIITTYLAGLNRQQLFKDCFFGLRFFFPIIFWPKPIFTELLPSISPKQLWWQKTVQDQKHMRLSFEHFPVLFLWNALLFWGQTSGDCTIYFQILMWCENTSSIIKRELFCFLDKTNKNRFSRHFDGYFCLKQLLFIIFA